MGSYIFDEYELSLSNMIEPVPVLSHIFRHLGVSEGCSHPCACWDTDYRSLARKCNFPSLTAYVREGNMNFSKSRLSPISYHVCDLAQHSGQAPCTWEAWSGSCTCPYFTCAQLITVILCSYQGTSWSHPSTERVPLQKN